MLFVFRNFNQSVKSILVFVLFYRQTLDVSVSFQFIRYYIKFNVDHLHTNIEEILQKRHTDMIIKLVLTRSVNTYEQWAANVEI